MKKIILITLCTVFLSVIIAHAENIQWTKTDEIKLEDVWKDIRILSDKVVDLSRDYVKELKDITSVSYLIEFIDDGYDFSTTDIRKHVYNRLKAGLSREISFCDRSDDCLNSPYIYVNMTLLENASVLSVSFKRSVLLLPNKVSEVKCFGMG